MTIRVLPVGSGGTRAALVALLIAATLAGLFSGSPAAAAAPPADTAEAFLARHWQRPIAPQGRAPATFGVVEAALDPASCGTCHAQQWSDWKTALHSRAMSPGLLGQLQEMGAKARDDHQACLECHAPLAEQADDLQRVLATPGTSRRPASGASHADSLSCAGCHVRGNERFGPPRRDGSSPGPGAALPHGAWQASSGFLDSRFCAACHQFKADGFALNGKLLENTYEEWRASRYAREDRSCQSCHMPDRRHLWRGIHDPAMVKSGLAIETSTPTIDQGHVRIELKIANIAIGHAFPTYVTPRVTVEIGQEDRSGRMIPRSLQRHRIARAVSLDLAQETADTRLMPDEARTYRYDRRLLPQAVAMTARIRVEPDAFYADFYRATLQDADFKKGRSALEEALRRATESPYLLYESRQVLKAASASGRASADAPLHDSTLSVTQ